MKWNYITGVVCAFMLFAGQVHAQVEGTDSLQMVMYHDKANELKEMVICPPVFCSLPDGKRVKMKICNDGEETVRKVSFCLFYKKKRLCKVRLPHMQKGATYEFAVNIHEKLSRKDRENLEFELKKADAIECISFRHIRVRMVLHFFSFASLLVKRFNQRVGGS